MDDDKPTKEEQTSMKEEADAAIEAAVANGLISPDIKLGELIKLGKGNKATTLGYVAAWDKYVAVVK